MTTAVYPGSFDPVTLGHLDVMQRAAGAFDRLVVAVLVNPRKSVTADAQDRAAELRVVVTESAPDVAGRIEVMTFEGLTVDLATRLDAGFIVRGLRAVSDFESEMQMAHTNRKLRPAVDTVFFMTALEHAYLSSSLIREIATFGGDVSGMVPPAVARRLGLPSP
ncbi:MAG: pantetheine-phosphate adenylyltransferase [Chloroflexota bacterium]|nr:pantetheine-phosphate adenylyltransferase [Chloroflexota bacterium]